MQGVRRGVSRRVFRGGACGNDLAPRRVVARRGVERIGPLGHCHELGPRRQKAIDLRVDLGNVARQQAARVAACRLPGGLHPHDLADLGERETRRLRVTNEPQPVDGIVVVVAIAVAVAIRLAHEADALVVPNRLGRETRLVRQFSDAHASIVLEGWPRSRQGQPKTQSTIPRPGTAGPAYDRPMRTSPRRIGLLGGITWHSTLEYERLLHVGIAAALPGQSADLVIRHYNFGEIAVAQAAGDWDGLAELFARDARWLVEGGAEAILICANTMHLVAPQVEAAVDVPLIHVVDETAKAIRAVGLDTVALLGTGFTMRMPFYRDRMATFGITTLVPDEPDLTAIHELVYDDLANGIVTDAGRALAKRVTGAVLRRGARGVIAGCTEIPMVMTAQDVDVPYFDALALHARAAVEFALAD